MARLKCSGAITFRPTEWGVWMVGTHAHPLGGDRLLLRLGLGDRSCAEIRSASASIARRGPRIDSGPSIAATLVLMGNESSLLWSPEPGIAAKGSHHVTETRVRMEEGSRLAWRDEFVVGRHGEDPGTWRSRLRVTVGERVVLNSENSAGPLAPGWRSPAVLRGAKAVSSLVLVGPGRRLSRSVWTTAGDAEALGVPLGDGHGTQITAWGEELDGCREAIRLIGETVGINPSELGSL